MKKNHKYIIELKKVLLFTFSKQKPVIFDHLPKCGGSSINKYLISAFPSRYTYTTNGASSSDSVKEFKDLPAKRRHKIKLIYGHLANELFDFVHPDSVRATIFRNPIDRIVSHYYYVKRAKNNYLHKRVEDENIQLDDYCYRNLSGELENWYVSHFSGLDIHEVQKNPEKSVELAYSNIVGKFHVIGFQDDISSFIEELKQYAKINTQYKNEIVNKTKNRKKVKDIDQGTIERISKKNSLDLELFKKLYSKRKNNIIKRR